MIDTPSLRARVTIVMVVTLAVLLLVLEAFVYLSMRARLGETLGEVLDTRVAIVERLARDSPDLETLDAELTELGVIAELRAPDGTVVQADPARRFDAVPPGDVGTATVSRTVELPSGAVATVIVSRAGVDATLERILVVELIGSGVAIALAGALLMRMSSVVTRPMDRMVATAMEIAEGDRTRRLSPKDPTTELGRMAATFDRTIDALHQAVTEAEEAEARSRRFLADAAHQLRTPIAGVRASAEVLVAHPDGADAEMLAANVAAESARLSRLVDRLLRIARLDGGEVPDRQPTDLAELTISEVARQRPLAPSLTFTVTAEPGPEMVATCDPAQLREALANLLDNARRFAASTVDVEVVGRVGSVEIRVHDDGPGVPADQQEAIFDRFTTTAAGSGLGLPIAQGIAEGHGGQLSLQDGTFVLRVPRVPVHV